MDEPAAGDGSPSTSDADDGLFLVPYRWWRELRGQGNGPDGTPLIVAPQSSPSYGMKIINNIFSSDLVFNLRREDGLKEDEMDEGVSSRNFALVRAHLWSQALRQHRDSRSTTMDNGSSSSFQDSVDFYPLTLRISVTRETNILTLKISKKDNATEGYKKACKLFSVDSEPVRIWDFSEQTNLILLNEWNRLPQDCHQRSDQEIVLELQVINFSSGAPLVSNDTVANMDFNFLLSNYKRVSSLGLTGLENLGNTCFMNSALQCLAHTPKLVDYFLGDYSREINHHNPLGLKGELALAFGELLRKLWAPDRTPIAPRAFKSKLARFAPQFSGYNQHDSQELLAFLLDGLHEDLNRVKHKPYIESKDSAGRPDEEVAEEYWGNHLARNDSIIVDICQGQYKSTLVCPVCSKVSITFDPFMYLSLPLPSTIVRTMTITVFNTDGCTKPSEYTINVPKFGKLKDLIQALSISCSLRDDESLLIAEVYASRIIRFLEDLSDSISLIRDEDRLAAYRLQKDMEEAPLVVFVHQRMEEHYIMGKRTSSWKAFGVPLIMALPKVVDGYTIQKLFGELLGPFKRDKDFSLDDDKEIPTASSVDEVTEKEVSSSVTDSEGKARPMEEDNCIADDLQFHLTDDKSQVMQRKIEANEPVWPAGFQKHLYILVCWKSKTLEQFDVSLLHSLSEIYKIRALQRRSQEPCSLYACLEAFLKEEPLGPEDMWYCPGCKQHQQASKKLDLWRLPEILVIHLKRFSYSRYLKNKLGTFVDFPIHDLDFSTYLVGKSTEASNHYRLYAISNHYGHMGGGHYTAYVYHEGENRWYDFDDRNVLPVAEDSVKSAAAYVLFYRRI